MKFSAVFTLLLKLDYWKSVVFLISSILLIVKYILKAKLRSTLTSDKFCPRKGCAVSLVVTGKGLIFRDATVDIANTIF